MGNMGTWVQQPTVSVPCGTGPTAGPSSGDDAQRQTALRALNAGEEGLGKMLM